MEGHVCHSFGAVAAEETGGIGLQDCLGLQHGPAGVEPWLKRRATPQRLGLVLRDENSGPGADSGG